MLAFLLQGFKAIQGDTRRYKAIQGFKAIQGNNPGHTIIA